MLNYTTNIVELKHHSFFGFFPDSTDIFDPEDMKLSVFISYNDCFFCTLSNKLFVFYWFFAIVFIFLMFVIEF